jgi:hypothetical protein
MLFLELGCSPLREIIRERRLGFLYYILNEESESMVHRFFKSQLRNRTKRDWVTSVIEDLEFLGLGDLKMEQIRNMKKVSFIKMVKAKNGQKTFEKLQLIKKSHTVITMQKYLQPNQTNITREEAQLIFKLRCRVTEVKNNLQGKYDSLECEACGLESETQQHILMCKVINRDKDLQEFKYEKLFNGTVMEKLKIARIFKENFKILENMKKAI